MDDVDFDIGDEFIVWKGLAWAGLMLDEGDVIIISDHWPSCGTWFFNVRRKHNPRIDGKIGRRRNEILGMVDAELLVRREKLNGIAARANAALEADREKRRATGYGDW